MKEKHFERKECDGCRYHNPECRRGSCCLVPYSNRKTVVKKEGHDTS